MRSGPALFLTFFVTTAALAAPPRIFFERLVPAPYDLGQAEEVAIIGAIGDTNSIEYFIEQLIEQTGRAGTLRLTDVRRRRHPFVLETLKKNEPADAYLAIRAFTCASEDRGGEGSGRDVDGQRIKRREMWVETKCSAKLEVLAANGTRASLAIKGEGNSTHVAEITDEDREDALLHASRFTAIDAAEKIAPRRVRESIALDETAPAFEQGLAMISSGRLEEARAVWENEVRRHPRAAPLHFNLAAVCEAIGDRKAAELHYVAARQLAPDETRYSSEYRLFVRRAN